MESFTNTVSNIKEELNTLDNYSTLLLEKTRSKASNILDSTSETHISSEIQAIEEIFKDLTRKVKEELKQMHDANDRDKNKSFISETMVSHSNALTKRLTKILAGFRNIQIEYRNRENHKIESAELIENLDSKDKISNTFEKRSNHGMLSKVEERRERVRQIAGSITDLCCLIDELHDMTRNQTGVIDKIEVRMEETKTMAENARIYLQNTLSIRISTMQLRKVFVLIMFVILFIITVLLILRFMSVKRTFIPIAPANFY